MRRVWALLAVVGLFGVCAVIWPGSSDAANFAVSITDFTYTPSPQTVSVGDTVDWTNNGTVSHSVSADAALFESSPLCPPTCIDPGGTFSFTFTTPGTFPYHCRLHGGPGGIGMSGVIIVDGPVVTTTTAGATTTTAGGGVTTTTAAGTTSTTAGTATTTTDPSALSNQNVTNTAQVVTAAPTFTG